MRHLYRQNRTSLVRTTLSKREVKTAPNFPRQGGLQGSKHYSEIHHKHLQLYRPIRDLELCLTFKLQSSVHLGLTELNLSAMENIMYCLAGVTSPPQRHFCLLCFSDSRCYNCHIYMTESTKSANLGLLLGLLQRVNMYPVNVFSYVLDDIHF